MINRITIGHALCLICAGMIIIPVSAQEEEKPIKVEKLWEVHCSVCHGAEFEGGMGGDLIDDQWDHGSSDEEIYRAIEKGMPDLGMLAFEETLSPEEIRALVIYIREKEKAARLEKEPPPQPEIGEAFQTQHHQAEMELVAEGFDLPWSLAFLPDGRMLVSERKGDLRLIEADGTLIEEPISGTPEVRHRGQGGLMEVAIHPEYEENGWIYLGISDPHPEEGDDSKNAQTAVVRGRIEDGKWVDQEWIYRPPVESYTSAGVHFGTRFIFQDEYLFFVMGERGSKIEVQDLGIAKGEIYRVFHDGKIPSDNPFFEQDDAEKGVRSYGHRNPQGLAMDPRNKTIYSTEHGPRGGDEFNLIRRGANYGWPIVTHGMNYKGTPITAVTERKDIETPLVDWTPSIAACGLDCYLGDAFSKWKYDFFAGGLKSQELWRLRVEDGKVTEEEIVLKGVGRIRDVRSGPDGYLYLVLNKPGQIVRMRPLE